MLYICREIHYYVEQFWSSKAFFLDCTKGRKRRKGKGKKERRKKGRMKGRMKNKGKGKTRKERGRRRERN